MERPEKKEEKNYPKGKWQTSCDNDTYIKIASGNYNQACDDWEAYHEQEIKIALEHIERLEKSLEIVKGNERTLTKILTEMPSEEELKEILWDIARIEVNSQASVIISQAFAKRING